MSEPKAPEKFKRRYTLFPKQLGEEINRIVKPVYQQNGFSEHRLLTEWSKVVGADLARYSAPKKLVFPKGKRDQGTLHISVFPGRALELQHMLPIILERIASYFGYNAVQKLVFTQDAAARPALKKKSKPIAAGEPQVTQAVALCEDADLRAVLASLGTAINAKNQT